MNTIIENIINASVGNNVKFKKLDELQEDIKIAKDILKGKYTYCSQCKDYYLTESFLNKIEHENCKICTYEDPINSGGNEYVDGIAMITYSICPKGHKKEINREEKRI